MTLDHRVAEFERTVERHRARRDAVVERIEVVQAELVQHRQEVEDLEKVHGVITAYAQTYQEKFLRQIEEVVTSGLQAIFDEPMRFRVEQNVSGKRLEVKFFLVTTQDGETLETAIMDSRGGGVSAVVGFLLRVAVLLLVPNMRKLLVLDETFAQLSVEHLPALSEFIAQLTARTGIQVVLVTHSPELTADADKVYRVAHVGGKTVMTEEK